MVLHEVDIKSPAVEVNEDTIKILEEYLAKAKVGEITEVVIVGVGDLNVHTKCSMTMSLLRQLGALEVAKANVISHCT